MGKKLDAHCQIFFIGDSVDEVSVLVKKHDGFEKLFATQEDKVALLNEHGSKLLAQNHFESGIIAKRLAEVNERRNTIREMCQARRNKLDDALLHAQFNRDVAEVIFEVLLCFACLSFVLSILVQRIIFFSG